MELRRGSEGRETPSNESSHGEGSGNGGPLRRVGVFGGSFDPPHAGHLFVASQALERAALDQVLFVPAARPPHKLGKLLSPGEARVSLLEVALGGAPEFCIEGLELEREGPSYTIDTVRALLEGLGGRDSVELFLIIGGDNLQGLGAWREAEALLELVTPLVIHRGEDLGQALDEIEGSLPTHLLSKLRRGLLSIEPHPASSTAIRAMLGRGEDPGGLLPAGCLDVVKEYGLYGYSE